MMLHGDIIGQIQDKCGLTHGRSCRYEYEVGFLESRCKEIKIGKSRSKAGNGSLVTVCDRYV